jgi:hypothetical protein
MDSSPEDGRLADEFETKRFLDHGTHRPQERFLVVDQQHLHDSHPRHTSSSGVCRRMGVVRDGVSRTA